MGRKEPLGKGMGCWKCLFNSQPWRSSRRTFAEVQPGRRGGGVIRQKTSAGKQGQSHMEPFVVIQACVHIRWFSKIQVVRTTTEHSLWKRRWCVPPGLLEGARVRLFGRPVVMCRPSAERQGELYTHEVICRKAGTSLTWMQKCQQTQPSGKERTVGPCHLQDSKIKPQSEKKESNPLSYTEIHGLNQSASPKVIFPYLEEYTE